MGLRTLQGLLGPYNTTLVRSFSSRDVNLASSQSSCEHVQDLITAPSGGRPTCTQTTQVRISVLGRTDMVIVRCGLPLWVSYSTVHVPFSRHDKFSTTVPQTYTYKIPSTSLKLEVIQDYMMTSREEE